MRVYCRCESFQNCAKFVNVSKYVWTQKWYAENLPSPKTTRTRLSELDLQRHEVAIISDMHFGSVYQQKSILDSFIQDCKDRNIQDLLCLGDLTEGLMARPNHEATRFLHTASEYEDYVVEHYPKGFTNSVFIPGNHESSFIKHEIDYDFGEELVKRRPDLTYLKQGSVIRGPGGVRFCLHHGSGSCAAPGQSRNKRLKTRVLQLMSEEKCAEIFIMGHCHRINVIPSFMNAFIVGTGCFVAPDDTLLRVFGGVDICGLILSYSVLDGKPVNIKTNFRFAETYGGVLEHDY